MTIKQNLVPNSKYALKCPHQMSPVGICVHNTANDAAAKGEIAYMVSNANQTSFHFAVDDIEAWQGLPLDRNGWHAGDGSTGDGNRKHIAIEICYSKSGGEKFDKAEENAAELIAQLLKERNWGIEVVKKHQDFSGKYCPHRTLDLGWQRFLTKVRVKLGASMPNMYGTPNQYDLSNPESMKVAVDKLNEVLTGVYIRKDEAERLLNEQKLAYEKKLKDSNDLVQNMADNRMGLAVLLGLDSGASCEQILAEVKGLMDEANQPNPPHSSPEGTLPATIEVNGEQWGLNGVNLVDGKLQGNYNRL